MAYRHQLAFVVAFSLPAALTAAHAQVIAVKSAPIADGGQFAFLPSANLGMGGLSIALADSSLDPFINPAKGTRLAGMRVFGSPTFFSVSRKAGGGLTLPVGMSNSSGAWFAQLVLGMQDMDRTGPDNGSNFLPPEVLSANSTTVVPTSTTSDDDASRQNNYVHGLVGRRFGRGLSVAASASWWTLNIMDGVELYYPGSNGVRQHGEALDLRLGVLKELGAGHSFEVLALHNRLGMNQDVAFTDTFWDPTLRQFISQPRIEPNADRTDTWGLHLAYMRPLADSTWRVGAILTGNWIDQPRLPSYDLPEVPADAGRAHAYNLGGGLSRSTSPWTLGFDAIYEPIWSRTWVRADQPTEARDGATIETGGTTLENQFHFHNGIARLGFANTVPISKDQTLRLEIGGQLRAIRYRLEQWDAVQQSASASTQHWNEWTRTWGVSYRLAGASVDYRGSLTTGAGRPGFDEFNGNVFLVDRAVPVGVGGGGLRDVIPPFGLQFGKVRTTTHQISFSVPIR